MSAPSGIVTFLTDFGHRDPYVGIMKGVVLGLAPALKLVDLTHDVAPQDVSEANFALRGSYPFFPPGTVHVIVVDPGVGTQRRIVAARAHGALFVAPDNGVLTDVVGSADEVHAVTDASLYRDGEVSQTFHGRDILAPVAARLASGLPLERVGPRADDLVRLERPDPAVLSDGMICGAVLHVDRFGNLISNVREEHLRSLPEERRNVRLLGLEVGRPVSSYGTVPPGTPLAIVDSFGFLEVAVNGGSAEKHFNALRGDPIRIG